MEQQDLQKAREKAEKKSVWDRGKAAYKREGNIDAVLEHADISDENRMQIAKECSEDV